MARSQLNPGALLAPVPPVLVTTGTLEAPNVCTVAWCGMLNTKPPKTYISLRPQRYSYELLQQNAEFVLNLPTTALVRAVDYCGVKSGRDEDKFVACNLTAEAAFQVAPPHIAQSPVSLECRVFQTIELGSHHMLLADIVAVGVDETLLDKSGKLDLGRANLCAYVHGAYYSLGQKLGTFGYSVRKRKKRR